MSSDTNVVVVTGRLGTDPQSKSTSGGTPLTTFRLAVNRWVPGRDGAEGREDTSWVSVTCWQHVATKVSEQAAKGNRVLVEGRLQIRSWEDEGGQKREATEIVAERVQVLDLPSREGL